MLKFRSIVSQLSAAFPYNCLRFSFGSGIGFHIILIAELHKKDSEIPMTIDQLSWFASLNIMTSFSCIITGLSMHRLGSRVVGFATAALYFASWMLYYYSTNATTVLFSRVLISLTAANTLSTPYISEISEPQLRGPFLAIAQLAVAVGTFFTLLLGNLMYWRNIALVNLTFPILAAVTVLATPNSPTWLASNERLEEAKKALCWLRGWVQPSQVQAEFRTLVENLDNSKSSSDEEQTITRRERFLQVFHQRSFWLPLATMVLIYFLHFFSGVTVIRDFSAVIFTNMNSPIEQSLATTIIGAMGILGNILMILVIRRTGKRKLAFFSVALAAFCHLLITVVGFLKLQGEYLWISPIAMIIATFAYESGVGMVVYMFNSEIFPSSVRYIGSAIGMAVSAVMSAIVNKSFLYVVEAITLPAIFLAFAFINVAALITYIFLFPETEGRSLKEIEDHFKGVKHLDQREK